MQHLRSPFGIALGLIAIGLLCFVLQPIVSPQPEAECVPDGQPSSGFVDEDKDCNVSIESSEEIREWESSPKPLRIIGALLVAAGIVTAVVAVVRRRRGTDPPA